MNEITIHIYEGTAEPGYFYDIFEGAPEDSTDESTPLDGGFCTTTIENAMDMAVAQAKKLINA